MARHPAKARSGFVLAGWRKRTSWGAPKTVWQSGLRRWLKAPVRKGVGSNPTAVSQASRQASRQAVSQSVSRTSLPRGRVYPAGELIAGELGAGGFVRRRGYPAGEFVAGEFVRGRVCRGRACRGRVCRGRVYRTPFVICGVAGRGSREANFENHAAKLTW